MYSRSRSASVKNTVIGLIAVFFLKEIELRGGRRKTEKVEETVTESAEILEQPVAVH